MKLHFGQIVVPYPEGVTSVDVARKLEENYGLKATFYRIKQHQIESQYTQAILDMLKDAVRGVPIHSDPNIAFGKANDTVTQMFRDMLNKRGFDGIVDGIPTLRAEMGISRRFKSGFTTKKINGKKVRVSRASFIDTKTYLLSSVTYLK